MPLQLHKPLISLDIETTGLDVVNDRIIEIALIKLDTSGQRKTKAIRLNPGINIPKEASDIHGITNDMVKDCPLFSEVANEIKQFIGDSDFCGFNCLKFDIPLLVEEFLRAGISFDLSNCKIVDVQRIYHKFEPRDLGAAYKFYCNKKIEQQHSAQADAEATLDVLLAQVEKYHTLGSEISKIEKMAGSKQQGLDWMNRVIEKDGVPIFNFGKHKGKPVAQVFKEEPHYYDWIMKSDFGLNTKQVLSSFYAKMSLASKS